MGVRAILAEKPISLAEANEVAEQRASVRENEVAGFELPRRSRVLRSVAGGCRSVYRWQRSLPSITGLTFGMNLAVPLGRYVIAISRTPDAVLEIRFLLCVFSGDAPGSDAFVAGNQQNRFAIEFCNCQTGKFLAGIELVKLLAIG